MSWRNIARRLPPLGIRTPFCSLLPSCSIDYSLNRQLHFSRIDNAKKKTKPSKRMLTKYEREAVKTDIKSKRPVVKAFVGMKIGDLAAAMDRDVDDIILTLIDSTDAIQRASDKIPTLELLHKVCRLCGYRADVVKLANPVAYAFDEKEVDKDQYPRPPPDPKICEPRPPVVTIMGHVDHGKTTLLDSLRNSQIVASEFGGITQHIGAFRVKLPRSGETITFLDTPGHAAFHAMRQRGANATDIVVLVVAAEDGVMDQTLESIRFANQAEVPIVVAINKCDKPKANPDATREMLMAHGVITEEHGGDVQSVCVSALHRTNLDQLQEAILTQAGLMDLKADYSGPVEGVIVESKTEHGKGKVCTVLVQRGSLSKGRYLVAGEAWCRVRTLSNENGVPVGSVPPSWPVEVSGWKEGLPSAGDLVLEVESEARAKEVVAWRQNKAMQRRAEAEVEVISEKREEERKVYEEARAIKLEKGFRRKFRDRNHVKKKEVLDQIDPSIARVLLTVKADVDGSLEAILSVLDTFHSEYCHLELVDFGVGQLAESEVENIAAFNGSVYLFNTSALPNAQELAKQKSVPIKQYNVIYHLVANLKAQIEEAMPTYQSKEVLGTGYVLKEFLISIKKDKDMPIAGCLVKSGVFSKTAKLLIKRKEQVIYDGECSSMRVEKDSVKEAISGQEVGIMIGDKSIRFEPDDTVECYQLIEVKRALNWNPPGF